MRVSISVTCDKAPMPAYDNLLKLVKGKDCFVLTTAVCPKEIRSQSVCIDGNIGLILRKMQEKL